MMNLNNYKSDLNLNQKFQMEFLKELGRLGVSYVQEDDNGIEATRPITERFPASAMAAAFTTTSVEEWPHSYEYDHQRGILLNTEDCSGIDLLETFRELAATLEEEPDYVDRLAAEVLDFNRYGFPNSELKSVMRIGRGDDAHDELVWDQDKFADVLVGHLPFRTWERALVTGEKKRDLFLYTDENGYQSFGPNEMDSMLQEIGVPHSHIEKWYRPLVARITNHPNVPRFHEWDTSLIACRNGVLDPWTLELKPHSPDDYVKHRLVCDWNPDAVHPMADKIFDDIPDPDDRAMVKAMLAVTLVGNKRRNFFVQKGVTGTGKSTITELWMACVLGDALSTTFYAQHAFGENDASRFGLIGFDTAFMAVCDDLTGQRIKDSGMLKTVTSSGTVSIQYKGKDAYNALARAVVIINSNDVPNFEDRSGAILGRAVFINRDCFIDPDKRINFSRFVNDDDFKSRLLTIVIEAFQDMKVQEDDGSWSYRLPIESLGGKAMRVIAINKGTAVISAFKRLLSQKRIIGMSCRDILDDLAEAYSDINTIDFKAMGTDVLNNALHSIGVDEKLRLQLYSKPDKLTLIQKKGDQKAWSVRASAVVAFSSLNANEREEFGKHAVRYREVVEGRAIAKCMEIADKNYPAAEQEWQKFMESYNFVLDKIREYDPEAVEIYELQPVKDPVTGAIISHPVQLDFHDPNEVR